MQLAYAVEGERGRYAVAVEDIAPGQAVLLAAPYALTFNPSEFSSALYLAAKAVPQSTCPAGDGTATMARGKKSQIMIQDKIATQICSSGNATCAPPPSYVTPTATWCSGCYRLIAGGTPLLNYAQLRDLAIDITIEQDAADARLNVAEVWDPRDPQQRSAVKKPTKSSKMKKDSAVALKHKVHAIALSQRDSIIDEHIRQKKERAGDSPSSPATSTMSHWGVDPQRRDGGVVGCEGCGIVSYCSERCCRENISQHISSGECAALRCIFPCVMKEYYAKVGKHSMVVMPGDEPKHWSRSSSEDVALEAQAMLLVSLVLARSAKEGYFAHWRRVEAPRTTDKPAVDQPIPASPSACTARQSEHTGAAAAAAQERSHPPPVAESAVMPTEVRSIQNQRAAMGLTGVVEVLDADPALGAVAASPSAVYFTIAAPLEETLDDNGEAVPCSCALQQVRVPRYADLAQMVTNLSVLPKDRRSAYSRLYRRFCKLFLPRLILTGVGGRGLWGSDGTAPTAADLVISECFFTRLCAVVQSNSFGIFTPEDRCLASGIFPEASYFNHSCAPNLCRVMTKGGQAAAFYALRPICAGDALTICYTDVQENSTAERRRNLLAAYRFFCECVRCGTGREAPTPTKHLEVPLCGQCPIRGYLRPLRCPVVQRSLLGVNEETRLSICTACGKLDSSAVEDGSRVTQSVPDVTENRETLKG